MTPKALRLLQDLRRQLVHPPITPEVITEAVAHDPEVVRILGGGAVVVSGFETTLKGLTGTQGVMMPESNIEDLMLREDVLEAVTAGKFHIWPVAKVEQGIEILTGSTAGQKKGDGKFEPGTVFALMDERMSQMARKLKEFE